MLSNSTIFKRLRGKRILILGFGREGKSSLAFIKKYLPHAIVGIADKNESAFKDLDLNQSNPKLYFGDNYFDAINDYDIVIKTPGISLLGKDVDLSKITSQTDLFLEEFHDQIIGVTGTKGKSTTSTLIYHLLKESGRDAILAGNIGEYEYKKYFDNRYKDKTVTIYGKRRRAAKDQELRRLLFEELYSLNK